MGSSPSMPRWFPPLRWAPSPRCRQVLHQTMLRLPPGELYETDRCGNTMRNAHAPGRETHFRVSRRRNSSRLRRAWEVQAAPHSGAPRTGRDAHGRRLRARHRRRWRSDGHFRTGRHQHGYRDCDGDARFFAGCLHHWPGQQQTARFRCVSGSGHYRHHHADHQTQCGDLQGGRYCAHGARGVYHREFGTSWPCAGGYHQRCAAGVG